MNANDEKVVMTAEEHAFIDDFVAKRCIPHGTVIAKRLERWCEAMQARIFDEPVEWKLAAAGGILPPIGSKSAAPVPMSPDETVRFVFASESDIPGKAWRAELIIPPNATVGTVLSVKVSGLGIDATPEGVLTLAGCRIPLVSGEGGILFDLFLNGVRNAEVSLARADGTEEPGRLMFI